MEEYDNEAPVPKLTPEQRDQIIREAIGAQRLLGDADLSSVMEEIKWQHLSAIASTKSHEKREREDAYWAIQAVRAIEDTLKRRVLRAQLLLEHEEQMNKEHNDYV